MPHPNPAWLKPHQFQPGQSGNMAGRPPGNKMLAKLKEAGQVKDEAGVTRLEKMIDFIWNQAAEGNWEAIHCLLDRLIGKPSPISVDVDVDISQQSARIVIPSFDGRFPDVRRQVIADMGPDDRDIIIQQVKDDLLEHGKVLPPAKPPKPKRTRKPKSIPPPEPSLPSQAELLAVVCSSAGLPIPDEPPS
jgi:Family of unknown function (DUF5681)